MARSNNNNKLKAYVRFDGSGRVVSSSLIVQAFKPKVGNWKEIDAKECCNYVPTTTSTTTAVPTTTTSTTTLFFYEFSSISSDISAENACTNPDLSPILYTLVEILTIGVAVYDAPELTAPANNGYYVVDGIVWHIVGGIITEDLGSC
jgi:hypothetical protein